jgi:hypothetical protein
MALTANCARATAQQGSNMSLHALRKGHHVKVGTTEFLILRRLTENRWQLQNTVTGEWCTFAEDDLLDLFARNELSFNGPPDGGTSSASKMAEKLARDLATCRPELVALARTRLQYLNEIDRQQPISLTRKTFEPLIRSVSKAISDARPPSCPLCQHD